MQNYLDIVGVPIITTIVTTIIAIVRYALSNSEKFERFVPLVSLILGAVLGITIFYSMPSTFSATNVVDAIFIGGASGLSATGIHQIVVNSKTKKQKQTDSLHLDEQNTTDEKNTINEQNTTDTPNTTDELNKTNEQDKLETPNKLDEQNGTDNT